MTTKTNTTNPHKPTNAQRLAGAFVEVNACASMVLEMLDAVRAPEATDTSRLEAMASHMELMVQRIGYVNQVAANLACPGLLDAPRWSNWMNEPTTCDYTPDALPTVEG
jgi:hypothetical protein